MFGYSPRYQQIISLASTFVILWAWMACVLVCSDIAEHNGETKPIQATNNRIDTECVDAPDALDNCAITTVPVIFQERQTVSVHALTSKELTLTPFKNLLLIPLSLRKSDINQHSPPETILLLFLQFCNFRI